MATSDDNEPARGIARGVVIGCILWVLIFGGAAILAAALGRAWNV